MDSSSPWTLSRLRDVFPQFRFFRSQQSMFDYLDRRHQQPCLGTNVSSDCDRWMPFSIEQEPTQQQAWNIYGKTFLGFLGGGGRQSRPTSRAPSEDTIENRQDSQRGEEAKVEELMIQESSIVQTTTTPATMTNTVATTTTVRKDTNYPTPSIQQRPIQTRFFLAAPFTEILNYVSNLPLLEQHLYEVIRCDQPCKLYLDVECEEDGSKERQERVENVRKRQRLDEDEFITLNTASAIPTDPSASISTTPVSIHSTELSQPPGWALCVLQRKHLVEYCYDKGPMNPSLRLRPAALHSSHICPFDCPLQFDSSKTTCVLLRELETFLAPTPYGVDYASLIVLTSQPPATVETLASHNTMSTISHTTPAMTVQEPTAAATKFSQHYILNLCDKRSQTPLNFRHNRDAGLLVRSFVQWLRPRALLCPEIHEALFYHSDPGSSEESGVNISVEPSAQRHDGSAQSTQRSRTQTTVRAAGKPLRCVIDLAVYSRNRTLRCLGSSKLGKNAVLELDEVRWHNSLPNDLAQGQQLVVKMLSQAEILGKSLVTFGIAGNALVQQEAWMEPLGFSVAIEDSSFGNGSGVNRIDRHHQREDGEMVVAATVANNPSETQKNKGVGSVGTQRSEQRVPSSYTDSDANRVTVNSGQIHPPSKTFPLVEQEATQFCAQRSGKSLGNISVRVSRVYDQTLLLTSRGTRYCSRIQREHKSNGIYLVVHRQDGWMEQRCFDPDCHWYKSQRVELSLAAKAELFKQRN